MSPFLAEGTEQSITFSGSAATTSVCQWHAAAGGRLTVEQPTCIARNPSLHCPVILTLVLRVCIHFGREAYKPMRPVFLGGGAGAAAGGAAGGGAAGVAAGAGAAGTAASPLPLLLLVVLPCCYPQVAAVAAIAPL